MYGKLFSTRTLLDNNLRFQNLQKLRTRTVKNKKGKGKKERERRSKDTEADQKSQGIKATNKRGKDLLTCVSV